jgi:hypothetical protein
MFKMTPQQFEGAGKVPWLRRRNRRPTGARMLSDLTMKFGSLACMACLATVVLSAAAPAQQKRPAKEASAVTAMVVMTPNGPATCDTWVQWRLPTANPQDKAAIEYWSEGYLSGLAAGTHHDVIGNFRREDLAAWLTNFCTTNAQMPLPQAIQALGRHMLASPEGGKL